MSADLGEFEGHPITGMTIVLKMPGGPLNPAVAVHARNIAKGDVVDFLVRTVAGGVAFDDDAKDDDAYVRKQVMKVQTMTIVDAEFSQERIALQEEANDRAKGIVKIPFGAPLDKGDIVHTDEFGVQIIGEAEIAAARERGVEVVETTPVIAEYNGDPDQRRMWPDEFEGKPRPAVGDDDLAYGPVTALIDPTTGAVLEPAPVLDEGGDDDALIGDAPAGGDPLPAGDVDPALVSFLQATSAEIKVALAGQMSTQWLDGLLKVELAHSNRKAVVNAIKERLTELEGGF